MQMGAPTFNWTGAATKYSVGDYVYLLPEEEGSALYIAKIRRAFENTLAVDEQKLCIEVGTNGGPAGMQLLACSSSASPRASLSAAVSLARLMHLPQLSLHLARGVHMSHEFGGSSVEATHFGLQLRFTCAALIAGAMARAPQQHARCLSDAHARARAGGERPV